MDHLNKMEYKQQQRYDFSWSAEFESHLRKYRKKKFRLVELMANVTEMLYEKAAFETLVIWLFKTLASEVMCFSVVFRCLA